MQGKAKGCWFRLLALPAKMACKESFCARWSSSMSLAAGGCLVFGSRAVGWKPLDLHHLEGFVWADLRQCWQLGISILTVWMERGQTLRLEYCLGARKESSPKISHALLKARCTWSGILVAISATFVSFWVFLSRPPVSFTDIWRTEIITWDLF